MSDEEYKEWQKGEAERQHAAAKRTLAATSELEARDQDSHINSMLTTDAHVGKVGTGEQDKPQEMEDLKVDKKSITGGETKDKGRVKTIGLETPGKGVTDEIVIEPKYARPAGGAPHPLDMAKRAAAAVKEAVGDEEAAPDNSNEGEAEAEPEHAKPKRKR